MMLKKYFQNHYEILKIIICLDRNKIISCKLVILLNIMQGFFDIIYVTIAIPVIYKISGAAVNVPYLKTFNDIEINWLYYLFTCSSLIYLALKIITLYKNNKYSYSVGEQFGRQMIDGFSSADYTVMFKMTKTELLSNYIKIGNITTGSIQAILQQIGAISTVILMLIAVAVIGNGSTYAFIAVIILIYFIISNASTRFVRRNSSIISKSHGERNRLLLEFYKMKPESFFYPVFNKIKKEYIDQTRNFIRSQVINNIVGVLPKHIIEISVYVLIISYFYFQNLNAESAMRLMLSMFLMLKILPSMQTVYQGSNSIKATSQLINDHHELIKLFKRQKRINAPINLQGVISISSPSVMMGANQKVIKIAINDNIAISEFVLLKGPSGRGKSTLLKIIAGLIDSENGINIDGKNCIYLNDNFQRRISYLPQRINLINGTIIDNITMGDLFCESRFKLAVKTSKLDEFLSYEEMNLNKIIDENSNFSGGQLQRICLARALYKYPKIILIDEGLNGVDLKMERVIIQNIKNNYKGITLISVSHNENIDDLFDKIIYFV